MTDTALRPVMQDDLASIDGWARDLGSDVPTRTRPLAASADGHDPAAGLFWYVVVEDAREVGTVWIERVSGEAPARLGIFLDSPAHFGREIGRRALQLAVAEFRRACPDEPIELHVRRSNERAVRCYRSVGFEVTDTGSKALPSGESVAIFTMMWTPPKPVADSPNKAFEQTRRSEVQDRGVGARSSTPRRWAHGRGTTGICHYRC